MFTVEIKPVLNPNRRNKSYKMVAQVVFPFVPVIPMTREHKKLAGRESLMLSSDMLNNYDCVLISTDHDQVDYEMITEHAISIVDTRNVINSSDKKVLKA